MHSKDRSARKPAQICKPKVPAVISSANSQKAHVNTATYRWHVDRIQAVISLQTGVAMAQQRDAALEAVRKSRQQATKELNKIEKQIYELEGSFLESFPNFNALEGFDKSAVVGSRPNPNPENHRAFSASSLSSPVYSKSGKGK